MIPYKTLIQIDNSSKRPIFLQISDDIIKLIKQGILPAKTKLPGSRLLAKQLCYNRQTIISSYEDLQAQGWIKIIPSKGTFVHSNLPIVTPISINPNGQNQTTNQPGIPDVVEKLLLQPNTIIINRGSPDERLAPLKSLASAYKSALKSSLKYRQLTNIDIYYRRSAEEVIVRYLNETRGTQTNSKQIMLTQGSQMGIYLVAQCILKAGDHVIVGETDYLGAKQVFLNRGTKLNTVSVDHEGLVIDEIEILCQKKTISCLFVTPHHHLPTTVTLSARRRMQLLALAQKYNFYILEDDYDYDYHYSSSPLLPLASIDTSGKVIYVGSMSKNFAPGIRFGYLLANEKLMKDLENIRKTIDRHGDLVLAKAMSILIKEGDFERHLRKSLKIYRERRNFFCKLLITNLSHVIEFKVPDGGLAVWAKFHKNYPLVELSARCLKKGLYITDGQVYNPAGINLNATRLGFASLNKKEIIKAVQILKEVIDCY